MAGSSIHSATDARIDYRRCHCSLFCVWNDYPRPRYVQKETHDTTEKQHDTLTGYHLRELLTPSQYSSHKKYCSKMVYQTSDNDITKSFRDLIAEGKQRNKVIHAAGDDDITKSFRDLIAEGKHNSEVIHAAEDNEDIDIVLSTLVAMGFERSHVKKALIDNDGNKNQAIDYLVARSAANGTNHEQDVVAEDLATGSSLSGATTIIADADLAVLVTTAASAASDPAPTAPPDIESQRPQPPRIEQQIVDDDKCFCITCSPCICNTFSIFLVIGCMLLVGATVY